MKAAKRVAIVLVVLLLGAVVYLFTYQVQLGSRTADAVHRAGQILTGCEAYRENESNPARGKWPTALSELVRPSWSGASFLKDGEASLRDPWGNPYRYAVVTNAQGEQEVYVWGERAVDGKLQLYGAKRRADGTTEVFGLPK